MNHLSRIKNFVSKFVIDPDNFIINHVDIGEIKYSEELVKVFKDLPDNIQNDFFKTLLTDTILGVYNNEKSVFVHYQVSRSFEEFNIKNFNSEVDWNFLNKIHQNNTGEYWYNPGFTIAKVNQNKTLSVTKKGITTIINHPYHFKYDETAMKSNKTISIRTPSYQLSEYFYTAFGNETGTFIDRVYLYLNFDAEGASSITNCLTAELNRDNVPFMFHILHNPNNYHRYDSGFLIFEKKNYPKVNSSLKILYYKCKIYFENQTPIFTKQIAPGISVAEPSKMSFKNKDDFGLERSEILANSMIIAYQNENSSVEACLKYIENFFIERQYDIHKPYLKSGSDDIFEPLFE